MGRSLFVVHLCPILGGLTPLRLPNGNTETLQDLQRLREALLLEMPWKELARLSIVRSSRLCGLVVGLQGMQHKTLGETPHVASPNNSDTECVERASNTHPPAWFRTSV